MADDHGRFEDQLGGLIRQSKGRNDGLWEGTMTEYMALVHANPRITQLAPARIYEMIMSQGNGSRGGGGEAASLRGHGPLQVLQRRDLRHRGGAARPGAVLPRRGAPHRDRQAHPDPGGAGLLRQVHDRLPPAPRDWSSRRPRCTPFKDCPLHEEPLHLIPRSKRPEFERLLGVHIEGDLCPVCKYRLTEDERYKDHAGNFKWEDMPVVELRLSERSRVGIGTFQPSDPKNQDISELIGHVDLGKITQYGEGHPLGYSFDGELQIANRGLIEYIEILKSDIKFHYVLITVAQEQLIKAPGFPQILHRHGDPEPHQRDGVREVQGQQGERGAARPHVPDLRALQPAPARRGGDLPEAHRAGASSTARCTSPPSPWRPRRCSPC